MAIIKKDFCAQSLNQFAPKRLRGEYLDWGLNAQVMEAVIDASVEGEVFPGDAVKISATSKGKLKVVPAATGSAYGFVLYNAKHESFKAGDIVSVLCSGGVMAMVTEETIAAGAKVYAKADGSITATAGTNVPAGIAMEATTAKTGGVIFPVEVRA